LEARAWSPRFEPQPFRFISWSFPLTFIVRYFKEIFLAYLLPNITMTVAILEHRYRLLEKDYPEDELTALRFRE